jgi:hypothetical protein
VFLKPVISLLTSLLMSVSFLFGSMHPSPASPPPGQHEVMQGNVGGPMGGSPPRNDLLDGNSPAARMKLQRAHYILSTLVFDPQSYHLVLSSKTAFGGEAIPPHVLSEKPTMIIYQGALSPNRSNEEIAFMMAHELGHLNLHHMEQMNAKMEQVFNGHPIGVSGATFAIFKMKLQEREADMWGLHLYKQAGYSKDFFPRTLRILKVNPNIMYGSNRPFREEPGSLSMKDSHFTMKERFELLVAESQKLM